MNDFVPFNLPAVTGKELHYISEAMHVHGGISGSGYFVRQCREWLTDKLGFKHVRLTGSCTHALEIAGILLELEQGDEIIMPSYTFVTTANAFVLHGGVPVFVDIRPDTMNINEQLIEAAITKKTRAIVPVHYAGTSCEMDTIIEIAKAYNLLVIEDAAQALLCSYKGRSLGTLGDMSAFSFHETKNYTSGEGGCIVINDKRYVKRAEIIRQKGTDRDQFLRGEIDKYSWVDVGSSYVMSELNAAYLWAQFEHGDDINNRRHTLWNRYYELLEPLENKGYINLPSIPDECLHNAHMFYIKLRNIDERSKLIEYLKERKINTVFHYVPLHSSKGGQKFSRFVGEDKFTTKESERLLRLPLFYNMTDRQQERVVEEIYSFYSYS